MMLKTNIDKNKFLMSHFMSYPIGLVNKPLESIVPTRMFVVCSFLNFSPYSWGVENIKGKTIEQLKPKNSTVNIAANPYWELLCIIKEIIAKQTREYSAIFSFWLTFKGTCGSANLQIVIMIQKTVQYMVA